MTKQFIQQIRDLIAKADLNAALKQLRALLENSPKLNEILLQSARLSDLTSKIRQGLINNQDATITQNQITYGVLELLPELLAEIESQTTTTPAINQEVEQAIYNIENSKNVVAGSTINANVVIIGDGSSYTEASKTPTPLIYDYNKTLTRTLVEAMQPYNDKAKRLCQDFSWLENNDNRRKVQQFVFQNFVGEIGKQLRKLVNIGDDEQMDQTQKQKHFVNKCLEIAKRTFDLVNFTLLSAWWDTVKTTPRPLDPPTKQILSSFFDASMEQTLDQQFQLFTTLLNLFSQPNIPFQEIAKLPERLQLDKALGLACKALNDSANALDPDCPNSEGNLAQILKYFAFLTKYRMASIKKIGYRQVRNGRPEYLHRYVALGIDIKYSEDAEKGNWITLGEQTPAILLYQGSDYLNGVNLFPFVIDFNALTFEQGAKICFFSAKDLNDDNTFEYRFLGDSAILRIEKSDLQYASLNLNELMMNTESLKSLNLDCVVESFHDARRSILGENDNLFDNL